MTHAALRDLRPGALARFQDAFAHALFAQDAPPRDDMAALSAQPAFAVYRNTVSKACIDALLANYPAVARLTGEAWFRTTAAIYVREAPPATPMLLEYGGDFARFLAGFAPAAQLPYLPDVARLDRLWTQAHVAVSEESIDPAAVVRLTPDALARTVLRPHAAARWAWFEGGPIYTIWSRNRDVAPSEGALDWKSEGALLVRPRDAVEWLALEAGGCAFLDACAAGRPLGEAAGAALAAQPRADLRELMSTLLGAGAFGRLNCDRNAVPRQEQR